MLFCVLVFVSTASENCVPYLFGDTPIGIVSSGSWIIGPPEPLVSKHSYW